jgi:glucose-6-phosphate 1-dehydrogenase
MNDVATRRPVRRPATTSGEQPAAVLVVFGITGDLASAMTFRSLYRLERGGLLS